MNKVVLLLGSNVGDRLGHLEKAVIEINRMLGTTMQQSAIYETAPWGNTEQERFLNQVIVIQSAIQAEEIMEMIFLIEEKLGRTRTTKWAPRTIDIDILFFNDAVISTGNLVVPHPNLHQRKFTLIPLAEVMPGFIHPVLKKSVTGLLLELNDSLEVIKTSYNFA